MAKTAKTNQVKRPSPKSVKPKRQATVEDRSLTAAELRALNAWFQLVPPPLQWKAFVQVGSKSLVDSNFRTKLIADPRKALKEIDVVIPAGMKLNFIESTPRDVHIVLPPVGGFAEGKVTIRDEDLKAAFSPVLAVSFGDSDTKAGDWSADPTVANFSPKDVTIVNDTVNGDFTTKPPAEIDFAVGKPMSKAADGTDPVKKDTTDPTPRDSFWRQDA